MMVLLPEDNPKMSARWHGLYKAMEQASLVSYKILIPGKWKKIRQFHRNMLKQRVPSTEVLTVMVAQEEDGDEDQLHLTTSDNVLVKETEPILGEHLHVSTGQAKELKELLRNFGNVFQDKPGVTQVTEHTV